MISSGAISSDHSHSFTIAEAGIDRLRPLATAVGFAPRLVEIEALFRRILGAWADRPVGAAPPWPSGIGDDHTPFEWSLAFDGSKQTELRLLIEPLGSPPSLVANRDRAIALLEEFEAEGKLALGRFRAIQDLFLPDDARGLFSVWLAVTFSKTGPFDYKLYLNPECRGPALAPALVEEALVRLGFDSAWGRVATTIARRGPVLDEIKYFSLDLAATDEARVKVYARHLHPTVEDLEAAMAGAKGVVAGDVTQFLDQIGVGRGGPLTGRPPATCLAFVASGEDPNRPATATHHFPINGYASDDAQVTERVRRVLREQGLDETTYLSAIESFARRPLNQGIGLQSYASIRRQKGKRHVTIYLAPELYRAGTIAQAQPRPAPATAQEIVRRFEEESLADHPFFRRLRREPPNLVALWKLMVNAEIAPIRDFSRNLAQVVAKVDDNRIRSILAHQLNDELGAGKFEERAHSQLFKKMVAALSVYRPADVDVEAITGAGRALSKALHDIYFDPDGWVGVGATMLIEIFGKQVDLTVGDQFRRQKAVDPKSLEWLNLHEALEIDHAQESMDLADLVPPAALPSVWSGAERVWLAADAFYNELYEVCW